MRLIIAVAAIIAATPATAQIAVDHGGGIPPNAIDRATARDDRRSTAAADKAAADRLQAQADARAASRAIGPVPGSTLNDGPTGINGTGSVSVPENDPVGGTPPRF